VYAPGDWTQAHNLTNPNPAKLAELQRLWLIEATKYNVVPLDHRGFARIKPDIAGRPQLVRGNTQLPFDGLGKGGNVTLHYDGTAVGKGRVEQTQPIAFSADEACDVGRDIAMAKQ
jgi:hypothetical protein